jgi:UDP-N-acetyl-2-amino-2-deoxyglucuronate dehydrogenase
MTLNVALIGCGLNGRFHSTAIRSIARRQLLDINYAAVCDLDPERARAFAEVTGAEPFTDANVILDSPDIDAVYVCVPTSYHKPLVLHAAERGKHVFCEKPLATSLADVETMVAATEKAGVKTGVGLVLRHSPLLTVMKELMDDASLGRQMAVIFRDDQFFPIQGHYASEWRKDRAIAGAGTLLEHSIHDVDVLHWFGGPVKAVRGSIRNFAGFEGIEDLALAYLDFESGSQADLISIWHSVLGRPSTRRLEVFYEKGFFTIDQDYMGAIDYQVHAQNAGRVSEDEVRKRYLARLDLPTDVFEGLLRYSLEDYMFLRACIEDRDPFPNFRTALEAHKVVDAIYRSAEAGGELITLSRSS